MTGRAPDEAVLAALTAEHAVMQNAIGAAVSEQQARASMYLYAVSGVIVAIGFLTGSQHFALIVAAMLAALLITGLLTVLRLVDICMESLEAHVAIARIRRQYRSLGGAAEALFDPAHGRWPEGKNDSGSIVGPFLGLMTTAASMIACVNGMIGAALLSLLLVDQLGLALTPALALGAVVAAAQVLGFYVYQNWRIEMVSKLATDVGLVVNDEGGSGGDDN